MKADGRIFPSVHGLLLAIVTVCKPPALSAERYHDDVQSSTIGLFDRRVACDKIEQDLIGQHGFASGIRVSDSNLEHPKANNFTNKSDGTACSQWIL
jgi:hypothetical protein